MILEAGDPKELRLDEIFITKARKNKNTKKEKSAVPSMFRVFVIPLFF